MGLIAQDNRSDKIQVHSLRPHHRSMARLQVAYGLTNVQLAERFGMGQPQISIIVNSPLYKAELKRLESMADEMAVNVGDELAGLGPRAVEVIAEDLHDREKSAQRTKSAFAILDRIGHHKKETPADQRKQTLNFINLAPLPGEDPDESLKRIKKIKEELLGEEENE